MFVMYGGSVKPTTKGAEYVQYPHSIMVKVDESDRRALEQDRRFFFPAYLGPSGWLGLDFAATKKVDWNEVAELIDASFRLVAPKKLISAARRSLTRAPAGHGSIGAMSFASPFPEVDIPSTSVYDFLFGRHRRGRPRPGRPGRREVGQGDHLPRD